MIISKPLKTLRASTTKRAGQTFKSILGLTLLCAAPLVHSAPTFTDVPGPVMMEATGEFTPVPLLAPTATDSNPTTPATIPVTNIGLLPGGYPVGVTTVTWSALDTFPAVPEPGLADTTVTIVDTTPPTPPPAPADLDILLAEDVPPPVDLTATDLVDGDITVSPTTLINPGSSPNDFTEIRTWTFSDSQGNVSFVSQRITVLCDNLNLQVCVYDTIIRNRIPFCDSISHRHEGGYAISSTIFDGIQDIPENSDLVPLITRKCRIIHTY